MGFPATVTICEVGLRDGFQAESLVAPTDLKVELINSLAASGVPEIQIASFVHPEWVPQMADAEAVCERVVRRDGVTYTGLALNRKGVERAHAAGIRAVDLSISSSETHSQSNANMSLSAARQDMLTMIDLCHKYDMQARVGLQCVFGCANNEAISLDSVSEMAGRLAAAGVESISLADSTGVANPARIQEVVRVVQDAIGDIELVLHLHDTRGLGLANIAAALACGVRRFDTAMGGMGGCPFIAGATGNVATEDTVYMLESMGIETGVDMVAVANVTHRAEAYFGKQFPGRVHRLIIDRGSDAVLLPGHFRVLR